MLHSLMQKVFGVVTTTAAALRKWEVCTAQWWKCWGARKLSNLQLPVQLSTNSPLKPLFHPANDSIPTLYGTSFTYYIKLQFDKN
jgi:hypothetical protein